MCIRDSLCHSYGMWSNVLCTRTQTLPFGWDLAICSCIDGYALQHKSLAIPWNGTYYLQKKLSWMSWFWTLYTTTVMTTVWFLAFVVNSYFITINNHSLNTVLSSSQMQKFPASLMHSVFSKIPIRISRTHLEHTFCSSRVESPFNATKILKYTKLQAHITLSLIHI